MATLREIRAGLQWTQEKAASEIGVSLRTYARHEAGRPPEPVLRLMRSLAAAPKETADNLQAVGLVGRE